MPKIGSLSLDAARTLARFPGPVTLAPRWRKWRAAFLVVLYLPVLALPILVYLDTGRGGRLPPLMIALGIVTMLVALGFIVTLRKGNRTMADSSR